MRKSGKNYYKLILSVSLLLLLVLVIVLVDPVSKFNKDFPGVRKAFALATTVQPERLTELYFENSSNLPKNIIPHQKYAFAFTIHNLEGRLMTYPYVVSIQTPNLIVIHDKGQVLLKNGEAKSISENIGPFENIKSQIVVELVNRNQNISFWMGAQ